MDILRPIRLAVYFDQQIYAAGGYQQALNAALLVKHLPDKLVEPIFFTQKRENIDTLHSYGIDAVFVPLSFIRRLSLLFRRHLTQQPLRWWKKIAGLNGFENVLIKNKIDLVYFLSPTSRAIDLEELNYITTVWDLCHRDDVEFPEVRAEKIFEGREKLFKSILPKAVAILTDSPLGKQNVVRRYGIDEERVYVMPFSPAVETQHLENAHTNDGIDIRKKYQIDVPYVFYPAQFWPHKNHIYLLEGLKCLQEQYGIKVGVIFCGGNQGNLKYVRQVVETFGLQDIVRFAGFVPNIEIPNLYKQSIALVMPTYFGPTNLPPLEAFSVGVPVLYPDKLGLRDQVADGALLMDLNDPMSMAKHLAGLMEDTALRSQLIKKGKTVLNKYSVQTRVKTLSNILKNYQRRQTCWNNYLVDDYQTIAER